jgi:hypothetical protein
MNALIAAAKKEGQLNVITLPANWANYGNIMKDFSAQYGIHITDANPGWLQPGRAQRHQPAQGPEPRPRCR